MSIWHLIIVLSVVLFLLGGHRKLSSILGDFAQGIDAFKKGLATNKDPRPEIIGFLFVILGVLSLVFAVTRH